MVYAITEGEEKPLKYPVMFRSCELVVVNKMDLLPYLGFDLDGFVDNLRKVNPAADLIFASARTGEGVDAWCDWLRTRLLPETSDISPYRQSGRRPEQSCYRYRVHFRVRAMIAKV